MSKYVFVILHYQTLDDTQECVDSIMKCCHNYDYSIIIVDNASPNQTGKVLLEMYDNVDNVIVLLNKENVGFAKGNNVGFKYAKKNLGAQFIILLNNDTVLFQEDFCKYIDKAYNYKPFAVMGPMIVTADGNCTSNPISMNLVTKEDVKKALHSIKKQEFALNYHLLIIKNIKNNILKKKTKHKFQGYRPIENIRLHGCCLIFSNKYIEKFDGIDDRTFMYEEERFLQKRLQENNMISLYNPELIIYHKEYASTSNVFNTKRSKMKFYFKNEIESLKILLKDFE